MEINLLKYTNLISKMKIRNFVVVRDELKYKHLEDKEYERIYHLDTTYFLLVNKNKFELILKSYNKDRDLYITPSETDNEDLVLFCHFFNFVKYSYLLNIRHLEFDHEERYRFNTKEFIINLKQYVKNDIFNEIIQNSKKKKNDVLFLHDIILTKLNSFINNKHGGERYDYIVEIINKILADYKSNFIFENETSVNVNEELPLTDIKYESCDLVINNIERIHDIYLSLSRVLLELKKTLSIYMVKQKDKNKFIFTDENIVKNYYFKSIKSDFSILNVEYLKEQDNNTKLANMLEYKKKESLKQKELLNFFISNRSMQIFNCYKCGNLLKRTERQASTCLVDSNCKDSSYFHCYNCKINFCVYCICDLKNGKCAKGHLLFKFEGENNKNCVSCEIEVKDDGYFCNLCEIIICNYCYEVYGQFTPIKCSTCKYELNWRRGFYEKCKKCTKFKECFWNCYFCDFNFCIDCITPATGYCGQLHVLEEYDMNSSKKDEVYTYKPLTSNMKIKAFVYDTISEMKPNCTYCGDIFSLDFHYCKRCHYKICMECFK